MKTQAFNLYFQSGLSQQQIASMLGINRKTLYTWIRDGDWKRARHTARHAPTLLVQQYYDQLVALNAHIAARTENPFPTSAEADIMRKLSAVIKHVRTSWTSNDIMDIFTLFISDLVHKGREEDAMDLMPMFDEFVHETSEKGNSYNPLNKYYTGLREDEEYDKWLAEQQVQEKETQEEAVGTLAPALDNLEPNCSSIQALSNENSHLHLGEAGRGDRVQMGCPSADDSADKTLNNNQLSQKFPENIPVKNIENGVIRTPAIRLSVAHVPRPPFAFRRPGFTQRLSILYRLHVPAKPQDDTNT